MPTVSEIITKIENLLDNTYDVALVVGWMNTAITDLIEHTYLPTRATLTKVGDVFTLPSNYKGDLQVKPSGHASFVPNLPLMYTGSEVGYTKFGNEITLINTETDTITVYYERFAAKIVANQPTSIPDIPEAFHDLIVYKAAMQAMINEEELDQDERYVALKSEYREMVKSYVKYNNDVKGDMKSVGASSWVVYR